MTGPFRVAVIGAGIGRLHMKAFADHPDLFRPVFVCDLDEARARDLAVMVPGCATSTSLDAMIADDDIDIIDICLPPDRHRDAVLAALAAGKHVICEKPLVGSLAEVDELEAAARKAGRHLLPVYQYRFGNGLSKLRHLMQRGLAGKPLVATLETHWHRPATYYDVPWRGKYASELGGAVLGHAIHIHDLLSYTLGPVKRLAARTATRVNPIETEDCAAIIFEMGSGALVTSSVTLGAADDTSRMRFCFTHLTAQSGLEPYNPASDPWTFTAREPRRQEEIDEALADWVDHEEGYRALFVRFHAALTHNADLPVTIADAHASLELVTAIYQSAAGNCFVDLPVQKESECYRGWLLSAPSG